MKIEVGELAIFKHDLDEAIIALITLQGNSNRADRLEEVSLRIDELLIKRAPVMGSAYRKHHDIPAGTITWEEHLSLWALYSQYNTAITPEEVADNGGFSYSEFERLTGRPPQTWKPLEPEH